MPKARQAKTRAPKVTEPTPAQLEIERWQAEQEYLAWARRVIDRAGWNRDCRSRRCRRHGCQNARCEPRWHPRLYKFLGDLSIAQLQEDSIDAATRNGADAPARRALLASAKRNGLLPLPWSGREGDAADD